MAERYFIEYISTDIIEVVFDDEELESTGCGLRGEKIGRAFNTFQEMLNYLVNNYGLTADKTNYEVDEDGVLQTSKMVADHSAHQNGGWFEPTSEEIKKWKKGEMKLYVEDYTIKFHAIKDKMEDLKWPNTKN